MSGQIKIKQALNKAYRKLRPTRAEIDLIKQELKKMLNQVNPKESEEHNKNLVSDYLKNTAFKKYYINTKEKTDLVIHNGNSSESSIGVIIETKGPNNKTEMITTEDLNKKAMQQLLLYFLRERVTNKNYEIKNLIATNLYEWFIFDTKEFNRFSENKKLVKDFINFEEKRLSSDKTELFYKEIASPVIEKAKETIKFVYFDIRDYKKYLKKSSDSEDKNLIELQKILSPAHLLKLPFANDSNTLNKEFYNELLHIIGLEEYKEKSKKLIRRKPKKNRDEDSLIEATIRQIIYSDKLSQVKNIEQFGNKQEEQLYNIALELVIIWINRILFLKLLESQIVSYHNSNDYLFLKKEKVKEYDDLNTLFFQVLAVEEKDRRKSIKDKFPHVPFLNSSLFEQQPIEKETIFINNLSDDTHMSFYKKTVLKSSNGKINTLEYLLKFLNAFDFSSEPKEAIAEEHKTLINASVLGLIFEKINGYKDGSYFTPGFITMYMCRETICRAVVQKFREQTDFDGEDLGELKNFVGGTYKKAELRKYNEIINSLKICDPAVGSGHFLVSALNEIINIKAELGILIDDNANLLTNYLIDVENDELVVLDNNGEFFKYEPEDKESLRVQQTLFHEKERIIENCLFGVDINPNSVNICRLRLWIELLKNAYYKDDGQLETLPNIDINIKCGNSLISRYPLNVDLAYALVGSTWDIGDYRLAVMNYRNSHSKEQKRSAEKIIEKIKSDFHIGITENDPIKKKRKKIKEELNDLTIQGRLFSQNSFKKDKKVSKRIDKLTKNIAKLDEEIELIKSGSIYKTAFEWRFEFPEVLDEKTGDFTGFDILIANPPYVRVDDIEKTQRSQYKSLYKTAKGKYDLYYLFFEKSFELSKNTGNCIFISPNKFCAADSAEDLRKMIFNSIASGDILSTSMLNVFETAANYPIISILRKEGLGIEKFSVRQAENLEDLRIDKQSHSYSTQIGVLKTLPNSIIPINISERTFNIIKKLYTQTGLLSELISVSEGLRIPEKLESSPKETFEILKQYQFKRYSKIKKGTYISETNLASVITEGSDRYKKIFCDKIVIAEDALRITSTIDFNKRIPQGGVYFAVCKDRHLNILGLLGLLNSKLLSFLYESLYSGMHMGGGYLRYRSKFLESLPMPRKYKSALTKEFKQIGNLVEKILELVANNSKPNEIYEYEDKIDKLVYVLYGLTPEEINIIEGTNE